ncbi:MAG: hypothetical protein ACTTH7_08195 [Treponema sp.]
MMIGFSPVMWLILVAIAIGLLFLIKITLFPSDGQPHTRQQKNVAAAEREKQRPLKQGTPGKGGVCPVCRTVMKKTEKLITKIYPGTGDRQCSIYGCPHCYPTAENGIIRRCPVCGSEVYPESPLIAQLFERPGSRHVHILGCRKCRNM